MKKILMVAIMLVAGVWAMAQDPVPVKWRASARMTSATEGVLTVKATVQPGWHLYGMDMPAGGPKATSFDFTGCKGVELIGSMAASAKPVAVHDVQFGMDVTWWEGSVSFTRRFRKTAEAPVIDISVTYMGCNDKTCAPPRTERLSARILPKKDKSAR